MLKVEAGEELSAEEVRASAEWLTDPAADAEAKAAFLEALHRRGETPAEIAGYVGCFLESAVEPVIADGAGRPLLDVCGTGGDRAGFFNVSTAVMFVAAACGAVVVKHGNRGITSKCGGADVLEALGVPIDLPPAEEGAFLGKHGFVFLFAPNHHPAFKAVAPVRKLLAERGRASMFNILGPLLNPARPDYQLTGVFSPELPALYAEVLARLGRKKAWIVHGELPGSGGLDEISLSGKTRVVETAGGEIRSFEIDPEQFGLRLAPVEEFSGGDARTNAALLREILAGAPGPRSDLVALNTAAALVVAGLADGLGDGLAMARHCLQDGRAAALLDGFNPPESLNF